VDEIESNEREPLQSRLARGSERRRHERRSGLWAAQLETTQGQRRNCLILDMSSSGAKLRIEQPAARGDVVTLVTERFGTRRSRVVWAANHRAGIIFLDKLGETPSHVVKTDPKFLRGRADVLRRLARSSQGGDAAAGLLRLALSLESEAAAIEKQQSTPR
jgi:hypothetical protein